MRCFAAVWLAGEAVDRLGSWPRPRLAQTSLPSHEASARPTWAAHNTSCASYDSCARYTTREQWHVTLRFFGELDDRGVELAGVALHKAAAGLPGPVRAVAGPQLTLLGPGLVVWPVSGLELVAEKVVAASSAVGAPPADRPFLGHVTVARARGRCDLRPYRALLECDLAASWEVRSIALVASELRQGGAVYCERASYPLGHPPPNTRLPLRFA
ncbi:MAG TPA: hypothetical protein VFN61_14720 [Acidimicrobiales bacterium]|nr:hypothetical protein [Acidimicrobiales bacterium]